MKLVSVIPHCEILNRKMVNMFADDISGSYILDSRPSSDFKYETAKIKLANLELSNNGAPNIMFMTPGDNISGDFTDENGRMSGRQGQLMKLAGLVDLDSKLTVRYLSSATYVG